MVRNWEKSPVPENSATLCLLVNAFSFCNVSQWVLEAIQTFYPLQITWQQAPQFCSALCGNNDSYEFLTLSVIWVLPNSLIKETSD